MRPARRATKATSVQRERPQAPLETLEPQVRLERPAWDLLAPLDLRATLDLRDQPGHQRVRLAVPAQPGSASRVLLDLREILAPLDQPGHPRDQPEALALKAPRGRKARRAILEFQLSDPRA